MNRVVLILIVVLNMSLASKDIFHEKTVTVFRPESTAEYFGYSVVLNTYGLIIGAPKAARPGSPGVKTGGVFNCSLVDLNQNVTCQQIAPSSEQDIPSNRFGRLIPSDFFKEDMWFGANIVFLSNAKMLIDAPRWTTPYGTNHLLTNGVSYLRTHKRDWILHLLRESNRVAYMSDGRRPEYGAYGTHLNFYAYGQAGSSAKVTSNNTVIFGAPGLLQWAGGIVSFVFDPDDNSIYFKKQPIPNPYFTEEIAPDDYFGYAVESGVFEEEGKVLYIGGAPRSKMGYGQVLVFEPPLRELEALNIRAKLQGPQLGAYFGASLCCTDIDGDGLDDLLVGAPMYVKKDGGLPFDQGAVFVYVTRKQEKEKTSIFLLELSGCLTGSEKDGARFGTTMADLGDVDGDGYKDIAIGAPWENDGVGVVYIYRGSSKGLRSGYVQRIEPEDGKGFGISIAKGMDVDSNNCNDLAIGAYVSETVHLYRCVPTMQVYANIKVPEALNLPQNASGFTAIFCVNAPQKESWPHVRMNFIGNIEVDPENNRAGLAGDSKYNITVTPGQENCHEQTVDVNPTADLTEPILIKFELEPDELMKENSTTFLMAAARLSEDSNLKFSFLVQLVRDCGEDLICTPWLEMSLKPLDDPYIPGLSTKLGAKIQILNKEEPAYGGKVFLNLPYQPKRLPSDCSLQDLNVTCDLPSPLNRNEEVIWEFEMEYHLNVSEETRMNIVAELSDPLYRNVTADPVEQVEIKVTPVATFNITGKSLPNATLVIPREKFDSADNFTFVHHFEITNQGPSDWPHLIAQILLPEKMNLSLEINGCERDNSSLSCVWSVPAKSYLPVIIPLYFNLNEHAEFLNRNRTYNASTVLILRLSEDNNNEAANLTTTLILEPTKILWPIIVASIVTGLILLATIIYVLHRIGFFKRKTHEELKNLLKQETASDQHSAASQPVSIGDESTTELLDKGSDSEPET